MLTFSVRVPLTFQGLGGEISGLVVSQCGKGRLFLGRNQPGGQDSPHLRPGRTRPTLGNDLQNAQESRCPELSFNARLSQRRRFTWCSPRQDPGQEPDQGEVTCGESQHRDQVPLGLITLETHLPSTRLLPSPRSPWAGWASGHQGSSWENRVPG